MSTCARAQSSLTETGRSRTLTINGEQKVVKEVVLDEFIPGSTCAPPTILRRILEIEADGRILTSQDYLRIPETRELLIHALLTDFPPALGA